MEGRVRIPYDVIDLRAPDHPQSVGAVLHVAESFGGGVEAAIEDYVLSTPGWTHHLLAWQSDEFSISSDVAAGVASVHALPLGHLARIASVQRTVAALQPDVVHAHSSYAGAYVRLALRRKGRARVVYTPHCYAFERRDIGATARLGYWVAERLLARLTGHVAAVSQREVDLAHRVGRDTDVTYVPNIIRADLPARQLGDVVTIAASGRLLPQKRPDRFAAAARLAAREMPEIRWLWIGGGHPAAEEALRADGVEVTGWVSHQVALAHLAHSDLYVHCAEWDGAPLALLEAAGIGVPAISFRSPAVESLGFEPLVDSPEELVDALRHLDSPLLADEFTSTIEMLRQHHTPEAQAAALAWVYESVAGTRLARATVLAGPPPSFVAAGRPALEPEPGRVRP
jgi:glycosyltransferase involved in cell wall biosynthesis